MPEVAPPDRFDLTGRHAVVTGAAGLLGREFADTLAAHGAVVHVVDLDATVLGELAESVARRWSATVHPLVLDITDEAAVDRELGRLGRVDILVNSAAINPTVDPGSSSAGHLSTYPLAQWEASLRVNLTGTFLMTRACCRTMEPQRAGIVVNIASTYGLVGPDQRIYENAEGRTWFKPVDYSVTKAGVLGFTRAVAAMYRGTGIRVNALTPGGTFDGQEEEFVQKYSARTILGRMAEPDEYRAAIAFLCSDASSYMTGANLVVDGGWTAW